MLTVFPGLLVYSFFAPTLLRLAGAVVFFILARHHLRTRRECAHELTVLSPSVAHFAMNLYILIEFLVAAGLFFGFWTQIAALVGFIICIKILFLKRSLHHLVPLSATAYVLLGAICLSLLLSGAGAIAFDLPL